MGQHPAEVEKQKFCGEALMGLIEGPEGFFSFVGAHGIERCCMVVPK